MLLSCAEVVVSPPFVFLSLVKNLLRSEIQVAAQNCWVRKGGAFTGEVRYDFTLCVLHIAQEYVLLGLLLISPFIFRNFFVQFLKLVPKVTDAMLSKIGNV